MPLTWSIADVHDFEELVSDERESVITEAVVFTTMAVGMWSLTEDNVAEFLARTRLWEGAIGPLLSMPKYESTEIARLLVGDLIRVAPDEDDLYRVADIEDGSADTVLHLSAHNTRPTEGPVDIIRTVADSNLSKVERHRGFEKTPLTAANLVRRIGLTTNASPKTKRQFLDHLYSTAMEDAKARVAEARFFAAREEGGMP